MTATDNYIKIRLNVHGFALSMIIRLNVIRPRAVKSVVTSSVRLFLNCLTAPQFTACSSMFL